MKKKIVLTVLIGVLIAVGVVLAINGLIAIKQHKQLYDNWLWSYEHLVHEPNYFENALFHKRCIIFSVIISVFVLFVDITMAFTIYLINKEKFDKKIKEIGYTYAEYKEEKQKKIQEKNEKKKQKLQDKINKL